MAGVVHNLKKLFPQWGSPQRGGAKGERETVIGPFRHSHFLHTLGDSALADMLALSQQRRFLELSPELSGKTALYLAHPTNRLILERALKTGVSRVLGYQVEPFIPPRADHLLSVSGSLKPLAAKRHLFDVVLFPTAPLFRWDLPSSFADMAKAMANGGRGLLSVIHPMLEVILYNQNPASPHRMSHTIESYFSALREVGLYVENVAESFVDKDVRSFFTNPVSGNYFDDYRGLPLVLYLKVVKYVKNL